MNVLSRWKWIYELKHPQGNDFLKDSKECSEFVLNYEVNMWKIAKKRMKFLKTLTALHDVQIGINSVHLYSLVVNQQRKRFRYQDELKRHKYFPQFQ